MPNLKIWKRSEEKVKEVEREVWVYPDLEEDAKIRVCEVHEPDRDVRYFIQYLNLEDRGWSSLVNIRWGMYNVPYSCKNWGEVFEYINKAKENAKGKKTIIHEIK